MQVKIWLAELKLVHEWTIARGVKSGGKSAYTVVLVRLTHSSDLHGVGEASPSSRYKESPADTLEFLQQIDPARLSFDDIPGSMSYVEGLAPGQFAAKGAINIALLDGAAQKAGQPLYDFLGLGFRENCHVTSFSIGIDKPEVIARKVLEARDYPVLKLKLGGPNDRQNFAALRDAAPGKPVRVDANEGWVTKEDALQNIEWLAGDGHVQFVEQPMPSWSDPRDMAWLRERSPLPLMADESYHTAGDVAHCLECFHGVNVKLCKAGGVSKGYEALKAARAAGLKTMLGCMIESSVLITAAAHLAELTDYLDIDGNLLISNDPYAGATADRGIVSFANAPAKAGLCVRPVA